VDCIEASADPLLELRTAVGDGAAKPTLRARREKNPFALEYALQII
jgi:hypothetical protein